MNPQDSQRGIKIESNGLDCSSSAEKAWNGCRANVGIKRGIKRVILYRQILLWM